jgi:phosphatidylserine/phosphatidylglycerophosphate/cardiolipin synthase-like enzyme
MISMTWLLIGTGFTGALTLVFLLRLPYRLYGKPPAHTVHFSPKGGCAEAVVAEIKTARHEILVQAYSFTSRPIAQALVDAKMRGVHVEIILDGSEEKEAYSDLHFFLQEGLTPRIDAQHAIAHNKVMVLDGHTVITGSFNFTNQAEEHNAENLLVLHHHTDLAALYRTNFMAHKEHSRDPDAKVKPAEPKPKEHKEHVAA